MTCVKAAEGLFGHNEDSFCAQAVSLDAAGETR